MEKNKKYLDRNGNVLKNLDKVILLTESMENIYDNMYTVHLEDRYHNYHPDVDYPFEKVPEKAINILGPHLELKEDVTRFEGDRGYFILPLDAVNPKDMIIFRDEERPMEKIKDNLVGISIHLEKNNSFIHREVCQADTSVPYDYVELEEGGSAQVGLPEGIYHIVSRHPLGEFFLYSEKLEKYYSANFEDVLSAALFFEG